MDGNNSILNDDQDRLEVSFLVVGYNVLICLATALGKGTYTKLAPIHLQLPVKLHF